MKTKHTPTPWKINQTNFCKIEVDKINSENKFEVAILNSAANAELIVRAVNCHEDLVGFLDEFLSDGADVDDLVRKADALLKRARGEV